MVLPNKPAFCIMFKYDKRHIYINILEYNVPEVDTLKHKISINELFIISTGVLYYENKLIVKCMHIIQIFS